MRKIQFLLLFVFVAKVLVAQMWETNFAKAKLVAEKENKNIILVFSGSDWCIPCMKLEKNIWSSPEFIEYSQKHYILVRADFPKRKNNTLPKEQQLENERLAEKYNIQGLFPLVVVLDKAGNALGSAGYKNITPTAYLELLHSFESPKP